MARLYEYQSKNILKSEGIRIPAGNVASTPEEVRNIAEEIGKPVALKIQIWTTGRASLGGIQFANTPQEAVDRSRQLFGMKVNNFVVEKLLVEEKLAIQSEYFAGVVIDDSRKMPLVVFSSVGGSGIEEIAARQPEKVGRASVDIWKGFAGFQARNLIRKTGLKGRVLLQLSQILTRLYKVAQKYDCRSLEINPLVLSENGDVFAADCHMAVDDYAVFRHPELGIEIAREFDRPPTELEKIAYKVEEKDYRGTFYFFQMEEQEDDKELHIGFHGAGGGGSMMSMDAVLNQGFKLANYCDTSGNPAASKVYRAAKIILSQPDIKGYFASGSGVASQEQYHSARGLVKAFFEEKMKIPGVIRLGGNYEEKAIGILDSYLKGIPGRVEGYGRDDSPEFCASRLRELIDKNGSLSHEIQSIDENDFSAYSYGFETLTGKIHFDHSRCTACKTKGCVDTCLPKILKLEDQKPVLAITREDAKKGKCTECLACEIFCRFHEQDAIDIHLPIEGLKEYREKKKQK